MQIVLAGLVIAAAGSPAAFAVTWSPYWTSLSSDPQFGGYDSLTSVAGGVLTLSTSSTDGYYNQVDSSSRLSGNYTLTVKFTSPTGISPLSGQLAVGFTGVNDYILLSDNVSSQQLVSSFHLPDYTGTNPKDGSSNIQTYVSLSTAGITNSLLETTGVWYQLARSGTTYTTAYSTDGVNFHTIDTEVISGITGSPYFGLIADGGGSSGSIHFTNLTVTADGITGIPEPAPVGIAAAGLGLLALQRRRSQA